MDSEVAEALPPSEPMWCISIISDLIRVVCEGESSWMAEERHREFPQSARDQRAWFRHPKSPQHANSLPPSLLSLFLPSFLLQIFTDFLVGTRTCFRPQALYLTIVSDAFTSGVLLILERLPLPGLANS